MSLLSTPRLLALLAGVYTIQSTIGAISFQAMPAILRDAGYSTDVVGMIYLLMLPWVFKFLWAPSIERYRLRAPAANRHLLLFGNLLSLCLLATMAIQDPAKNLIPLLGLMMLLALLCGSLDNAADGFAINNLAPKERGLGNTVQIGAGYTGAIIGGGLFLIVLDESSWQAGMLMICALVALLLIPLSRIPDHNSSETTIVHRPSLSAALRKPVLLGLLIILIYQGGLRLTQGMMMPFLIDQGVNLSELGFIIAFGNSLASLAAVLLSGWLLRYFSTSAMLNLWLWLQLPVYAGFYIASLSSSISVLHAALLLVAQSMVTAAAFVALYTAMMHWAAGPQAGVDFSIFQCTDTVIAMIAGLLSGWLVAITDYSTLFTLSLSATALGLLGLSFLLKHQTHTQTDAKEIAA